MFFIYGLYSSELLVILNKLLVLMNIRNDKNTLFYFEKLACHSRRTWRFAFCDVTRYPVPATVVPYAIRNDEREFGNAPVSGGRSRGRRERDEEADDGEATIDRCRSVSR